MAKEEEKQKAALKSVRIQYVKEKADGTIHRQDVNVLTSAECVDMDGKQLKEAILDLIEAKINALIDGAPAELDTLRELAIELGKNQSGVTSVLKKLGECVSKDDISHDYKVNDKSKVLSTYGAYEILGVIDEKVRGYDNLIYEVAYADSFFILTENLGNKLNEVFKLGISNVKDINALIASDVDFRKLLSNAWATQAMLRSATAMNAVAGSSTAMNAVAGSSTAMNAVAGSSTAMNAVAGSSTAMTTIVNNCNAVIALSPDGPRPGRFVILGGQNQYIIDSVQPSFDKGLINGNKTTFSSKYGNLYNVAKITKNTVFTNIDPYYAQDGYWVYCLDLNRLR